MKMGWETKPLQALCDDFRQDIVDGPFGSELQRKDYITQGVPVLKIQNVRPFAIELKKMDYISSSKFEELRRHGYQPGDIVMTKLGSPLGVSAIVEGIPEGVIVADLVRIRAQRVDTQYLCYQLNSQQTNDFINAQQKGTTRPRVTLAVVRGLPILVPPVAEQQRIVRVLDEAFAELAIAQANAAKNLQNVRALFESHLQSVFTHRGAGWVDKELGELCDLENGDRGINYPNRSARTASGIPFINAGHLTQSGLDMQTMDFISKARFELLGSGKVRPKDILFCLRGSLGKFASVGDLPSGAIASSLVIVRTRPSILDRFVLAYFASPICADMVNRFKNGAAQPNLSASSLKHFVIPVPPLRVQERIAAQLDALAAETQRLTRLYEQKRAAVSALKKSLLHQAFAGKL